MNLGSVWLPSPGDYTFISLEQAVLLKSSLSPKTRRKREKRDSDRKIGKKEGREKKGRKQGRNSVAKQKQSLI